VQGEDVGFCLDWKCLCFLFLSVSKCSMVRFHFLLYIDHYLIHTYYTVNKRQGRQLLVIHELRKFAREWPENNMSELCWDLISITCLSQLYSHTNATWIHGMTSWHTWILMSQNKNINLCWWIKCKCVDTLSPGIYFEYPACKWKFQLYG
jgi:hypothetical protein